jgi:hypothetical protein
MSSSFRALDTFRCQLVFEPFFKIQCSLNESIEHVRKKFENSILYTQGNAPMRTTFQMELDLKDVKAFALRIPSI